jgi:SAM-dependent methyltransferase
MLKVLKTRAQIDAAREVLASKKLSTLETLTQRVGRKLRLSNHLPVGDRIKSWDVKATADELNQQCSKQSRVLDIGAYCSEIPVILHRMGFTNVHGIDLNPQIRSMPNHDQIRYEVGNFLSMPYENAYFDAVTAISVIEHGYQPDKLFSEMARVLKPGGIFLASFDYWPDKIDIGKTQFFGMSWLIFSKADVLEMVEVAKRYDLEPYDAMSFDGDSRPIHCLGFDYTFAWIGFRKKK